MRSCGVIAVGRNRECAKSYAWLENVPKQGKDVLGLKSKRKVY